jgi:hypothetical protein
MEGSNDQKLAGDVRQGREAEVFHSEHFPSIDEYGGNILHCSESRRNVFDGSRGLWFRALVSAKKREARLLPTLASFSPIIVTTRTELAGLGVRFVFAGRMYFCLSEFPAFSSIGSVKDYVQYFQSAALS